MTSLDPFLDELAPGDDWSPSWEDVLRRATPASTRGLPQRKRPSRVPILALVLVAIAAILIPLVAVAASNDWWFLKHPSPQSTPSKPPLVVKDGAFAGKHWQLVAYPAPDGLCWSLTFTTNRDTGTGSALACGAVVGFPSHSRNPRMTITYLASAGTTTAPAWITGPVVSTAHTVRIRLAKRTITTTTIKAPSALGNVRFYVVAVTPALLRITHPQPGRPVPMPAIRWLAGYNATGRIVACLNPRSAHNGISPLSNCK